jgi:hypothetical protein
MNPIVSAEKPERQEQIKAVKSPWSSITLGAEMTAFPVLRGTRL